MVTRAVGQLNGIVTDNKRKAARRTAKNIHEVDAKWNKRAPWKGGRAQKPSEPGGGLTSLTCRTKTLKDKRLLKRWEGPKVAEKRHTTQSPRRRGGADTLSDIATRCDKGEKEKTLMEFQGRSNEHIGAVSDRAPGEKRRESKTAGEGTETGEERSFGKRVYNTLKKQGRPDLTWKNTTRFRDSTYYRRPEGGKKPLRGQKGNFQHLGKQHNGEGENNIESPLDQEAKGLQPSRPSEGTCRVLAEKAPKTATPDSA